MRRLEFNEPAREQFKTAREQYDETAREQSDKTARSKVTARDRIVQSGLDKSSLKWTTERRPRLIRQSSPRWNG